MKNRFATLLVAILFAFGLAGTALAQGAGTAQTKEKAPAKTEMKPAEEKKEPAKAGAKTHKMKRHAKATKKAAETKKEEMKEQKKPQ